MSLINTAYATTEAAAPAHHAPSMAPMLIVLAVILVFYFWMWRSQGKKTRERQKMIDAVSRGDEILTTGGIAGKVSELEDGYVRLTVSKGIEITVQKGAVASVLPKGTIKHL